MQFASLYIKLQEQEQVAGSKNGGGLVFLFSFFLPFFPLPSYFHGFFESLEFSRCGFLLIYCVLDCYVKVKLLKNTDLCSVDMENWIVWFGSYSVLLSFGSWL